MGYELDQDPFDHEARIPEERIAFTGGTKARAVAALHQFMSEAEHEARRAFEDGQSGDVGSLTFTVRINSFDELEITKVEKMKLEVPL